MLKDATSAFWVENTGLYLTGPVIFTKIVNHVAIIYSISSKIHISDQITFSLNQANYSFEMEYIVLSGPNAKLFLIANNFSVVFHAANYHDKYSILCLFQYQMSGIPTGDIKITESKDHHHNYMYSVVLQDNIGYAVASKRLSMSHCDWMEGSFFVQSDPFEVNKQIIHYVNNSMAVKLENFCNVACYCTDDQHYNCFVNEVGPVYPGQTFSLGKLVSNDDSKGTVKINIDSHRIRACKSHNIKDHVFLIPGTCTRIEYKVFCTRKEIV